MIRYLLFLIGVLLALPILAIVALALGLPITISGIGYLVYQDFCLPFLVSFWRCGQAGNPFR